jgi:hypothetical protein
VILDSRSGGSARGDGALDERVGIIGEHLDAGTRDARLARTGLCGVPGIDLMEEEGGAIDLKAGDATKVPQLCRAQCGLVPGNRSCRILDDKHHRDHW